MRDAWRATMRAWTEPRDEPAWRQRGLAAARRPRAGLAGPTHGATGRGDVPGDRARVRARRTAAPARAPLLVPELRRGDGDGLAFLRHHHQRDWRAQARPRAARARVGHPRVRWPRQAFARD